MARRGRGGRNGGRGNINLTAAELAALINDSVTEALAAHIAGQANNPQNNQHVCTFKAFMDCKPHTFSGAGGAVRLLRWFEKVESVFSMCNCHVAERVKFASGTLEGPALTRDEIQKLEGEFWNLKMEGSEIVLYTTRSHELARICPHMVTPRYKRIEMFINGLVPQIQSMVTSSNPTTIQQPIRLAHKLTDQAVTQGTLPPRRSESKPTDNNKRKFDSIASTKGFQPNQPQQQCRLEPTKNFNQSPL
ncbi:hypothetical protein L1987_23773 [Smallanthus sonchifolius]|uniref:Uncharacterized protein n=1 Tax=Smallanthus sonchifolius TaxID=185202 RepID=A0ACB9IJH2_9ASTR|nr:hypothetical protein L1987_23773 [Smallanthus sonchifolius]